VAGHRSIARSTVISYEEAHVKRRWIGIVALVGATVAGIGVFASVAQAAEARNYVALGDSYASGLGAGGDYRYACKQSVGLSYPARWAAWKGRQTFGDVHNRSCSGHTIGEVRSELSSYLDRDTGWVTVTVGGNDVRFVKTLQACAGTDADCRSKVEEGISLATTTLPGKLDGLFNEIRAKAPNAKVYVVGYPRLFVAAGRTPAPGCVFNAAKRNMLNHSADVLAEVIRQRAATRSGFTYVDGRTIFAGHEACTGQSWINEPFTSGKNHDEWFHPNATGYQKYADRLKQVTG
jgi:lysophospholipase L1-like esterase